MVPSIEVRPAPLRVAVEPLRSGAAGDGIGSTIATVDDHVIELQRLAQAGNADIAELVRRALTIATKLRLKDARSWIEHELKGYPPKVELPPYRIIPSELRVKNPFHGWNPVAWEGGGNLQEHFASSEIRSPLAEIIEIASATGQPHASLVQAEMDVLITTNPDFARFPSARFFSRASFLGILDGVRTKILDWSLDLEQEMASKISKGPRRKEKGMTRARPTMFIGSTAEALKIARAVQAELDHDLEITLWNQNVFEPGNATWIDLVAQARGDKYDLALIVLGAEDEVTVRGATFKAPRDNVLLELGLFVGAIGPERAFFLIDRDNRPKIASDLAGITALVYGGNRSDGNMRSAVGPACEEIRQRVEKLKNDTK